MSTSTIEDPTVLESPPPGPPPPAGEAAVFAAGQVVGARYRLTRLVALGGMGAVYEAEDLELRVRVALKTMRRDRTADPARGERFRRELTLARQVNHPHVCRVFDLGFHRQPDDSFVPFFTMEWLPGPTLAERIRQSGPLPPAAALPLIRQLAQALDAAHAVGVIHRDLKSQNIILTSVANGSLRAVITDFGLARSYATGIDVTVTRGVRGTPAYMAPEQIAGQAATPASDRYALGVVLHEMVIGKRPGPLPAVELAQLPSGWSRAILWLLSASPGARPSTAGQAIAGLAALRGARRSGRPLWRALLATAALMVLPLRPAPREPAVSVAGRWRGPGQNGLLIEQTGTHLRVAGFSPPRGPFRGRLTRQTLNVDFDDALNPGCCSGTVTPDHDAIIWSNHTAWRRNR